MGEPLPLRGVWVHVFEEDSAAGAVFKPEDADIPLSRRPRQRIELRPGGAATIWTGGPDDRPSPIAAQWTHEGGDLVVRDNRGAVQMRIVEYSADRLVAKLSRL
jgi:hypothetical protein